MDPCVPLPLDQKRLTDLVEKAKDYCLMHGERWNKNWAKTTGLFSGICMRRKDQFDRDALHFAPFMLFPSPFPRDEFEKAVGLQVVINELMHKVAHDYTFLKDALKHTVEVDEFTGRLWKIYQTICDEGGPSQVKNYGHT